MTSWGQCLGCRGRKTILSIMFPVDFTMTYTPYGHTWNHEACCHTEYLRIKKIFEPHATIVLSQKGRQR